MWLSIGLYSHTKHVKLIWWDSFIHFARITSCMLFIRLFVCFYNEFWSYNSSIGPQWIFKYNSSRVANMNSKEGQGGGISATCVCCCLLAAMFNAAVACLWRCSLHLWMKAPLEKCKVCFLLPQWTCILIFFFFRSSKGWTHCKDFSFICFQLQTQQFSSQNLNSPVDSSHVNTAQQSLRHLSVHFCSICNIYCISPEFCCK